MLSKTCQYAIKSLIYLTENDEEGNIPLGAIAKAIKSPQAFTSKILQHLVDSNLLYSSKGGHGGFKVNIDKIEQTTIGDIISIIDGDELGQACLLGLPKCSNLNPCALHHKYIEIRQKINHNLFCTTIGELMGKEK